MVVKKYKGKVFGATFTADEQKAIDIEVRRQLLEFDEQYTHDLDAMILYTLHNRYGWGVKRLKQFWDAFVEEHKALRDFYQMDEPGDNEWLVHKKLKDIGVDVEEWYKELIVNESLESL